MKRILSTSKKFYLNDIYFFKKIFYNTLNKQDIADFNKMVHDRKYDDAENFIHKLLKTEKIEIPLQYFNLLKEKTKPSYKMWYTIMENLLDSNEREKTIQLLEEMEKKELYPSIEYYNLILKYSFILNIKDFEKFLIKIKSIKDLELNSNTYNLIVEFYMRKNKVIPASNYLKEMKNKKLKINTLTFQLFIDYYSNDYIKVDKLFSEYSNDYYLDILAFLLNRDKIVEAKHKLLEIEEKYDIVSERYYRLFYEYYGKKKKKSSKLIKQFFEEYVLNKEKSIEILNVQIDYYLITSQDEEAIKIFQFIKENKYPYDENLIDKFLKYYKIMNNYEKTKHFINLKNEFLESKDKLD
jgi:hypothetical protein